jgi:5-methylthioadenosine/S-adenosylhomocysteine deaminase
MYYYEEDVAQATADAGMRAVCSQTVMKFPAPDARDWEEGLARARDFISRWKQHPLIVPSVGPHAVYTCPPEVLQAASALAVEYDVPLHIHISETAFEVETNRQETGMPVVPYVKKQNIFDAKVIAAHCVHVDEGEIKTLLHHKAGVAHNPSSNLKLASGFAPVPLMLATGLKVGIGTDGPASNNDLDMFEEVRLAAFVAKAHSGDPTALPAQSALLMATRMGAEALHLGKITGSIEPGKRADLILVDVRTTHNSPRFRRDPDGIYAQIVYAGKATDVSDVMINGRWLMRDRRLLTLNEEELIAQTEPYARQIDKFLLEREQSVLSKLLALGGATEGESFEVQAKVRIADPDRVREALQKPEIEILRFRHYHEYDTYFSFSDPKQGYLRYREDEFINPDNSIDHVRYRLTHIGNVRENRFDRGVLLSRSRFIAPAGQSLRFYREYFKPASELYIQKDRLRWRVIFRGTEFFINIDEVKEPNLGFFLEVKSRTWSRRDAEYKAEAALRLIEYLEASPKESVPHDYVELVKPTES